MANPRRIVMFNRVTADGYFAGPDGNLSWAAPDEEVDRAAAEEVPQFDTFLFGRRTYEMFASFWPQALEEGRAPHGAGKLSEPQRAMATTLNQSTKLVFSKTLKEAKWKGSRILQQIDPRELEALKKQPGKDLMVLGSGSIVAQLTQHGLIDEYQMAVSPIFLGRGRPLLADVAKSTNLRVLETKQYRSGSLLLRYARRD